MSFWGEIQMTLNSTALDPTTKTLDVLITEKAAEIMDVSTTGVGQTVFSHAAELNAGPSATGKSRLVAKFIAPKDGIYKYSFSHRGEATSGTYTFRINASVAAGEGYMSSPLGAITNDDTAFPIILLFDSSYPSYANVQTYFNLKRGDVVLITNTGQRSLTVKDQVITCDS